MRQAARYGRDQLSGPVRIGAIYTIGPYLFPELITNLSELAPDMPLMVEENFTSVLIVILLPAAHPLTARKSVPTSALENEPVLLLGAGHCFRDQVLEACPTCVPQPGRDDNFVQTVAGTSLETIRHMVASGMGVTILPCTAAGVDRYSQRLITIRRFSGTQPKRQVALAWRSSFPRPKVIDVLQSAIAASQLSCIRSKIRRSRRN